eukprot:CAMPEP_0201988450 /NCGR_PEP_ID=MMETSP0904-20121228/92334_1 /ASSEMBLY_ACC=CAM_ASM_000553 /TAXON_ID=420261 /ORGANISM="Thalassiosira antarctica, Strain CCMP982" /LENGTH=788 /DNA_ID=CAMNT_0048542623 /DNA_START=158 /DNA_END=2525 /DNA_ORIENTATION=-
MATNTTTPCKNGGDDIQIQIQEPILLAIADYAVVVPHPHHDDASDAANNKNTKNALKISPGVIGPHLPSWTLEDIESELTALVSIVPGCVYSFEHTTSDNEQHQHQPSSQRAQTPVLYLPTNYASHIRSRRIQTTLWTLQKSLFLAALAAMRVLAAAGILISIALLALFVVALIIAAIVAMSSQQNNGGHNHAMRRTRGGGGADQLIGLLRGALWYHYIFGDNNDGMMGYPMFGFYGDSSYLYWMMIRNMLRRNPRRHNNCVNDDPSPPPPRRQRLSNMLSVLDSDDDHDGHGNNNNATATTRRSLLAIVDEFLFGPINHKLLKGPASVQDVWRLRAAVVTSRRTLHPAELLPYVDNPPPVPKGELSLEDMSDAAVSEALTVVVHFRGTPDHRGSGSLKNQKGSCYYTFQELTGGIDRMAEGTMGCAETGMGDTNNNVDRPPRRRKCRSLSIAQGAGDDIGINASTNYDIDNDMNIGRVDGEETGPLLQTAASSNPPVTTLDTPVAKTAADTSDNPLPLLSVLCGHSSHNAPSLPSGGVQTSSTTSSSVEAAPHPTAFRPISPSVPPSSPTFAQGAGDDIGINANKTTYDIDKDMNICRVDGEETGPPLQTAASSNPPVTTLDTPVAKTAASTSDNPPSLLSVLCGHSSHNAPSLPSEWRPNILHDLLFRRSSTAVDRLPPHLTIGPTVFTNLSPILLGVCAAVAFVNLLCVHWMEIYGLALNGPLTVGEWPPAVARVVLAVAWLMRWYSFFFVAVPLVRLAFVVFCNKNQCSREVRRRGWAVLLRRV